jgi:aminoglycoside phosphotransferase (APT) family kinase protein
MIPGSRKGDPRVVPRIVSWLREHVGPRAGISVVPREVGGSGFSSDLYFIEVSGAEADERDRGAWVLRRERSRDALFPEADFTIESRIQRALAGSDVPVPAVRWIEDDPAVLDGRFYVMERVRGDALPHMNDGGWVAAASPRLRAQLWRSGLGALARIHAFDWEGATLSGLRSALHGASPLESELAAWWRLYSHYSEPAFAPLVERAFERLRSATPEEERLVLCWGDARHQNMLFRDGECVAVLDWEMAALGAPEKDVAFLLAASRTLEEMGVPPWSSRRCPSR